ncbi:MAG: DivIVA domain-containing protein [Acutalibacteraceae bacterium]
MANVTFTLEDNGYNVEEVNRYIALIQSEYANAVAWGESLEKELEQIKTAMNEQGVYFTITEENQNEVIKNVFDRLSASVEKAKSDAQQTAAEIIERANKEAGQIVRRAKENSVEIRTQNITIMQNLKSIGEMIDVIVEKGIQ